MAQKAEKKPSGKAVNGPPIIRPCSCKHESQDEMYGKQNRLWINAPSKGAKPKRYRCSVCTKEQEF